MVVLNKLYFFLLVLFPSQVFAQSVTALASVDSSDYLLGDYINYTIEIRSLDDLLIDKPVVEDSLMPLELIKTSRPINLREESINITRFNYILSYYDSSEITIPAIPIEFINKTDTSSTTLLTNPVTFNVHTVEVSSDSDIKDVKSPITIPLDWKLVLMWVLIGLTVLAFAYFLYKRYQKKKSEQPIQKKIIKIPAHIKALTELDNLEKEQLWQKGLIKDYHSNITGIVRGYFEDRFELPALELTTSESMSELRNVTEAEIIYDTTNNFLNNADLVKFAKFIPLDSVNKEMMTQAKEIVNKTIPVEKVTIEQEEVNV